MKAFFLFLFFGILSAKFSLLPTIFLEGDGVEIDSKNALTSPLGLLPVVFSDLDQCFPKSVKVEENVECQTLCSFILTHTLYEKLSSLISNEYHLQWMIDGLPALYEHSFYDGDLFRQYDLGAPLGVVDGSDIFLYNHWTIHIQLHQEKGGRLKKIVGFQVFADSLPPPQVCFTANEKKFLLVPRANISFTLSVVWQSVETPWNKRWEIYYSEMMNEHQLETDSVITSLIITLTLAGVIAIILSRALEGDAKRYSRDSVCDDDDHAWKRLYGDIFRKPSRWTLLCGIVASGLHLTCAFFLFLLFLNFGRNYYPSDAFSLSIFLSLSFSICGIIGGYVGGQLDATLNGGEISSKLPLLISSFWGVTTFLSFFLSFYDPQSHGTDIVFVSGFGWATVSLSSSLGLYLASFSKVSEFPVATCPDPRRIPQQKWYMKTQGIVSFGGILPLATVFFELFSLLSFIVLHHHLRHFHFFGVIFLLFGITSAEVSMICIYFQICDQNYHWWWRAVLIPAVSGIYMFIYSSYYVWNNISLPSLSSFAGFQIYNFLICLGFGLSGGSIGFLATFWFLKKIYGVVKVD